MESANFSCVKICILPDYYEIGIYLNHSKLHPLFKTGTKVDVSKNFCNGEHNFLFQMKEGCSMYRAKMFF